MFDEGVQVKGVEKAVLSESGTVATATTAKFHLYFKSGLHSKTCGIPPNLSILSDMIREIIKGNFEFDATHILCGMVGTKFSVSLVNEEAYQYYRNEIKNVSTADNAHNLFVSIVLNVFESSVPEKYLPLKGKLRYNSLDVFDGVEMERNALTVLSEEESSDSTASADRSVKTKKKSVALTAVNIEEGAYSLYLLSKSNHTSPLDELRLLVSGIKGVALVKISKYSSFKQKTLLEDRQFRWEEDRRNQLCISY
jgi:hypothetical protein